MIGIEISYDQGQFKRLMDKLDAFERKQVYHQTVKDVAEFMERKVKEYPPYKYVSRREAYGVPFFTVKQRRWFFAALRSGELDLPYKRTNTLKENWNVTVTGKGQLRLSNDTAYSGQVQGARQSRMMTRIGWQTIDQYLKKYDGEIGRVMLKRVKEWSDG